VNAVSQWWIGGLRTRKAKVAGSIPAGGSSDYALNMPASKYKNIYKYHAKRSRLFGLRMVFNVLIQIDVFDFVRKVNTRTIKKSQMSSSEYMWYSPVYTSVAKEMMSVSIDFYNSAIKYSSNQDKSVFLDLGGGLGKPSLIALESQFFSKIINIEIDKDLADEAKTNFHSRKKYGIAESIIANVEDEKAISQLLRSIEREFDSSYTLFVFNKNSYGPNVLKKTLELLVQYGPKHIIYLYQNPVHSNLLKTFSFRVFGEDSRPSNSHKNFKYSLYWK